LAIIGDDKEQFSDSQEMKEKAIDRTIDFAFEVIKNLAISELNI